MIRPTVVLVHGAFAESSSWDPVISKLVPWVPRYRHCQSLRGLKIDAAYVAGVLATVDGPVILVGHSYGGSVISERRPVRAT